MKRFIMALGVGFGVFGCTVVASAQYGGVYGGGGGYGFSSTVEEGIQRGFADVIRSAGQYNLLTAQAAVNCAEAVRLDAENRFRMVQGYFEASRLNREYQQAVNRMPDPETVLRYLETLRPQRYVNAKQFLVSVNYEAGLPVQ